MTAGRFTYEAMEDVLNRIAIALDDRPLSLQLLVDGEPFNLNGIPALRLTDEHGCSFVVTARPEADR